MTESEETEQSLISVSSRFIFLFFISPSSRLSIFWCKYRVSEIMPQEIENNYCSCSTNAWLHTPGSRNYVCGSRTIFCRASQSLFLPSNHGWSWSSNYCSWSHFPGRPIVLITYIWSSKPIYLLCCKKGEIIIESRDIMMKENCQVSANFRDMFMLFRAGPQLLLLFYWICTCWQKAAPQLPLFCIVAIFCFVISLPQYLFVILWFWFWVLS